MAHGTATRCPYVGLVPFSAEDAPFFFGREAECEIISANLMASRLTLLYGISGVGKSSVLRAGVIPFIRRVADQNRSDPEEPQFAIVEFSSWQDDPTEALVRRVHETMGHESQGRDAELPPPSGSLIEALEFWTDRIDGELLIVLDQFEDYSLYHPRNGREERFEREFSRAVNRSNLRANFLISIREDALAKLDRFKVHIPGLFDNYLRIEHLDREAGRAAIEGPIDKFNQQPGGPERPVEIEPELVEAVLDEVQAGRTQIGKVGRGGIQEASVATDATQAIETPFLQLVMSRLWASERRTGSDVLRYQTLRDLGGASHIVRSHLEESMKSLSEDDREILASVFDRLVTPSGTKIALSAADLAKYTKRPAEELTPVLDKLWGSEARILRSVEPSPAEPDVPRYEIFHDVLAPAVLEWRARYVHLKQVDRWRVATVVTVMGAILMAVVTSYVWKLKQSAQASEQRARQSEKAARETVNDYFTTVSEDTLLNQPGLQRLRQRLLEKARDYYASFLDPNNSRPLKQSEEHRSLQSEVARVNFYLGRIAAKIAPDNALDRYEDARKLQEQLLARRPDNTTLVDDLGDTLNAIGNLWDSANDFGQAIHAYDKAIDYRKTLSKKSPNRGEFKRKLANSLTNRVNAKTHLQEGDDLRQAKNLYLEALDDLRQAKSLYLEALKGEPDKRWKNLGLDGKAWVIRDLGRAYYSLAVFEKESDKAAAVKDFQEARKQLRKFQSAYPVDFENTSLLVKTLNELAKIDVGEARVHLDEAKSLVEPLARLNPEVKEYQVLLATIYAGFGNVEDNDRLALDWYGKSEEVLMRVLEKWPTDFDFESRHTLGLVRLIQLNIQLSMKPSSAELAKNAAALREYLDRCIKEFSKPTDQDKIKILIDNLEQMWPN